MLTLHTLSLLLEYTRAAGKMDALYFIKVQP